MLALLAIGALAVACPAAPPSPKTPEAVDAAIEAGSDASIAVTNITPEAPDAASAPALVADAKVPRDAAKLRVRRLPLDKDKPCTASALLARLGTCRAIATSQHDGTGGGAPNAAFDPDACRLWNAGAFPPQAIRATLDGDAPIAGILFVPEMTPNGPALHVVELDSKSFVVEAQFASGQSHFVVFDQPEHARSMTVRTTKSPSWVAWQKIVPFTCDGAVQLSDSTEVSPETPVPQPKADFIEVRVPGRGECTKDADCVPASCCHSRTCVAQALAPSCRGIGCAQNVVPGTIGHGARCACIDKKCGALRRERPEPGKLL